MGRLSREQTAAREALEQFAALCSAVLREEPSLPLLPGAPIGLLLRLAKRHRAGPPDLERLAELVGVADNNAAAALIDRAARLRLTALYQSCRLVAVSRCLSAAGVRHLAIKGTVVGQQLFGDATARSSKDLDVLVDPAALDTAAAALRSIGYEADRHLPVQFRQGETANKHVTFTGHRTEVEVHTRLLDIGALLPLSFEQVWERRADVSFPAGTVPTLGRVDTLLHLCAHGAAHSWFRLKWLEDIAAAVLHADRATWTCVYQEARSRRAEPVVVAALVLVRDLFGIAPPIALSGTDLSRSAGLVRLSKKALLDPPEHASAPPIGVILRRMPVQFGLSKRWRYRYDLLRTTMLMPRDFDLASLPKGFGWLRLPLRPVMLLRHRLRASGGSG